MSISNLFGLFIAITLLSAVVGFTTADINASTKYANEELAPKSFGSKTNICGDKLCSKINSNSTTNSNIEVIDIYPLSGAYYKILIKIKGEPTHTFENMLYVTSDMDTRGLAVPFINENSHDYVSTTIRASEPQSIKIMHYFSQSIIENDDASPRVEIVDISNISTQDNIYRVLFDITTKEFNSKNIELKITSDIDSITYTIGGLFEDNTQTSQVILRSVHPESITAQVVDFEINR